MVGLYVKEAWQLRDQKTKDGKENIVILTRLNDGAFIGTSFEAATNFGETLAEEEFSAKNKTPFTVSVTIFGGQR
jgi:hypothetical protein